MAGWLVGAWVTPWGRDYSFSYPQNKATLRRKRAQNKIADRADWTFLEVRQQGREFRNRVRWRLEVGLMGIGDKPLGLWDYAIVVFWDKPMVKPVVVQAFEKVEGIALGV